MLQCKPPCYLDLKSWVDEEVMTGFLNLASTWQTTQEKSNIVAKLEIYTCQTKLFSDAAAEDYIKAIRRPNSIQEFIEMSEHSNSNTILGHWRVFGASTPNLQAFAIKCMQQICSASVNETNWSQYDYVVPKRKIRMCISVQVKVIYCDVTYKLFKSGH